MIAQAAEDESLHRAITRLMMCVGGSHCENSMACAQVARFARDVMRYHYAGYPAPVGEPKKTYHLAMAGNDDG